MRWSIVRLICLRELRDQLRDRRTIFMIAVLPMLLYPLLGVAIVQFAVGTSESPSTVGLVGEEHLPQWNPASLGFQPAAAAAWLAASPCQPDLSGCVNALAMNAVWRARSTPPPLVIDGAFPARYFDHARDQSLLRLQLLSSNDRRPLEDKQVDLMIVVDPEFAHDLANGLRTNLHIVERPGDKASQAAARRLYGVLAAWKPLVRESLLARLGATYADIDPFDVIDSERDRPATELASEGFVELLVKVFPFLLVMWSLAGALYPAVDLCAGEKERGTMETLLISPASRDEIVWGKFLTIWIFSAATALLNLASIGITTWRGGGLIPSSALGITSLAWCVLLVLPLSAFFSALCLSVGAYARSSKEGQYYLMPLFLVTMPLVFLTLAPGVELNPFYSLVPVTGVALLMQRLMISSLDKVPWLYFGPVIVPIILYSWLALRWAIEQFRREEVLFREAERLDVGLWLRRVFREKEALPSTGQALFCFVLIMALRWLFFVGPGGDSLLVRTAIAYFAFAAAPPLFMSLILTTRPLLGLRLRRPTVVSLIMACLLAGLMLPPLAALTNYILAQFPVLKQLLVERNPLADDLLSASQTGDVRWWSYFLILGVIPALFEELAFRGFILAGLQRRLSPWSAIIISSAFFAIYHMNVFQAAPAFVMGAVLGTLTLWSRSIFPAMLFHLMYNTLLISPVLMPALGQGDTPIPIPGVFHPLVIVLFSLAACVLLTYMALRIGVRDRKSGSAQAALDAMP
jgi:sodium transport system permease protein